MGGQIERGCVKAKLKTDRVNFTESVNDERQITGRQRTLGMYEGGYLSDPDLYILKNLKGNSNWRLGYCWWLAKMIWWCEGFLIKSQVLLSSPGDNRTL